MKNITSISQNATAAYNKASQINNKSNFETNLKQAQDQFNQNTQAILNSIKVATPPSSSTLSGVISSSLKNLKSAFKKAETMSTRSLTNEADLVDVITSLNEAEITLKTTQVIRDKIISAYLEIFKMPI